MSVADKLAQSNLLCLGGSLIVKVRLFVGMRPQEDGRKDHKADPDRRKEKSGKGTNIDHILSACKTKQGGRRFLQIYKFIFKIIFNDEAVTLTSAYSISSRRRDNRHDLSPFGHMSRGNIDDIAVFIPVMDLKSIILKKQYFPEQRRVLGKETVLSFHAKEGRGSEEDSAHWHRPQYHQGNRSHFGAVVHSQREPAGDPLPPVVRRRRAVGRSWRRALLIYRCHRSKRKLSRSTPDRGEIKPDIYRAGMYLGLVCTGVRCIAISVT